MRTRPPHAPTAREKTRAAAVEASQSAWASCAATCSCACSRVAPRASACACASAASAPSSPRAVAPPQPPGPHAAASPPLPWPRVARPRRRPHLAQLARVLRCRAQLAALSPAAELARDRGRPGLLHDRTLQLCLDPRLGSVTPALLRRPRHALRLRQRLVHLAARPPPALFASALAALRLLHRGLCARLRLLNSPPPPRASRAPPPGPPPPAPSPPWPTHSPRTPPPPPRSPSPGAERRLRLLQRMPAALHRPPLVSEVGQRASPLVRPFFGLHLGAALPRLRRAPLCHSTPSADETLVQHRRDEGSRTLKLIAAATGVRDQLACARSSVCMHSAAALLSRDRARLHARQLRRRLVTRRPRRTPPLSPSARGASPALAAQLSLEPRAPVARWRAPLPCAKAHRLRRPFAPPPSPLPSATTRLHSRSIDPLVLRLPRRSRSASPAAPSAAAILSSSACRSCPKRALDATAAGAVCWS